MAISARSGAALVWVWQDLGFLFSPLFPFLPISFILSPLVYLFSALALRGGSGLP